MINKYLVVYRYGMGDLKAYIYANSAQEIKEKYPELDVITDDINTLSTRRREAIQRRPRPLQEFNLYEPPKGFLKTLLEERSK